MTPTTRRRFLTTSALAAGAFTLRARAEKKPEPLFKISLAQWTLVKEIHSGKIDHLDFPKIAADNQIFAVEYVNTFFMNKAKDQKYLAEMKKRATDLGVTSVLIMCDREGKIGDPDDKNRAQTVDNHRKWIDAAKFLGCHAIRVNAGSQGSWQEQAKLAADGLARLTEIGDKHGINVIVENHGGLSSKPAWLAEVMKTVNHPRCGTLPDTGNFRIKDGETCDSYHGVDQLMPWAKGVSIKNKVWDNHGNQADLDHLRMMKIVVNHGFHGHCGIEYGGLSGISQAREQLEKARASLATS